MLRCALMLLAASVGCRARPAPSPSACLVADPATAGGKAIEPRWLRLTGLRVTSDTTGVAEVGAYGAATMDGHWLVAP